MSEHDGATGRRLVTDGRPDPAEQDGGRTMPIVLPGRDPAERWGRPGAATMPMRPVGPHGVPQGVLVVADPQTQPIMIPVTEPKSTGGIGEGLALSISSALGALAGLASWLIAARLLPQAEVGLAAAVVSAFILIAGITQLNLGLGLMRWLPVAGRHAVPLVWRSLLLIMPLSALVGFGYVLAVPELARTVSGPDGPLAVGMCLFALATAGWGVFVVHDYILVAIGRPWWAVWRNGLFAVLRIGLLVVLGTALGAQGSSCRGSGPSWCGSRSARWSSWWPCAGSPGSPTAGSCLAAPKWWASSGRRRPRRWANTLLLNQVPLLVILRFGPEAGAAFFIAWQAAVVLETAATYYTHSLSASWARAPERAAELTRTSRRRLLTIFLPLLAVGALLAGPGLSIFGLGYAAAADVLRLLLLGLAFRLIVVHELGVRTAAGHGMAYARLHLASTLLVLVAALLVPASTEAHPDGVGAALLPVAVGYVAVQVVCAAHVVLVRLRGRARAGHGTT